MSELNQVKAAVDEYLARPDDAAEIMERITAGESIDPAEIGAAIERLARKPAEIAAAKQLLAHFNAKEARRKKASDVAELPALQAEQAQDEAEIQRLQDEQAAVVAQIQAQIVPLTARRDARQKKIRFRQQQRRELRTEYRGPLLVELAQVHGELQSLNVLKSNAEMDRQHVESRASLAAKGLTIGHGELALRNRQRGEVQNRIAELDRQISDCQQRAAEIEAAMYLP